MESDSRKLGLLIEAATSSPAKEVDPHRIQSIKNLVRCSDSNVSAAVRFLMDRMNKNHSQVRFLALLITDELFSRSKLFRSLWVQSFPRFLLLSVGFRRDHPLPPPADRASLLRSKTLEVLESWNKKFGQYYKQLRLGYHYLKNTLRLPFPNPTPNPSLTRESDLRAARTQELLRSKFETLRQNFESYKSEIQSTIDEINECCEILCKKQQEEEKNEPEFEEFEYGSAYSLTLRRIREEAMNAGETPVENQDNEAVFDVVRELYKLLSTKHMIAIQDWLFVLMRVDLADNRVSESMLKEVIDLRTVVLSARAKCEKLGCQATSEEDEVIWEEGAIGNSYNSITRSASTSALPDDKVKACQNDKDCGFQDDKGQTEAQVRSLNTQADAIQGDSSGASTSVKQKLAQEAPVLPWGSYLDAWGSNSAIPANQRGLEIENHWGRVDMDAVIPPEIASEFNVRAVYYKDQQHEIQPCGAPLRKGGFCQRRDLRVCPLHGPIRQRDSNGKPIDEKPDSLISLTEQDASQTVGNGGGNGGKRNNTALMSQTEDIDELSSQLKSSISKEQSIRLIAAQALDNVRSREEEAKEHKQTKCREAKRAKLTKVREHNASVLRNSSISSTSQGLGEAIGEDLEGWSDNPNKQKRQKQSLSSLLKKKPTVKDRLGQKLLNSRVSDATIRQLTKDEHANYKESFANQW